MTNKQRREREIRERVARATPGPWRTGWPFARCNLDHEHDGEHCDYRVASWRPSFTEGRSPVYADAPIGAPSKEIVEIAANEKGGPLSADAEFIAHAREDVPWLLARLDKVRRERDQMRVAVRALHAALAVVLDDLEKVRREKRDILAAAYDSERRGQKHERELERESEAVLPVVDAAVAWLHGDPDEDLVRAVADYVAAHGHKTENA